MAKDKPLNVGDSLPDISKYESPERRLAFIRKEDVERMKGKGWEVLTDATKNKPVVEGQTPVDTTIGTHDMIAMKIEGRAKERWEKERKRGSRETRQALEERYREMEERGIKGIIQVEK